ncbi:hypothetical protein D3C76_1390340 [compost metagenome]
MDAQAVRISVAVPNISARNLICISYPLLVSTAVVGGNSKAASLSLIAYSLVSMVLRWGCFRSVCSENTSA